MAGLGDEVVTRCTACGYALTARRYAVPHECPICRAPLDAASAPTQQGDSETRAESPPDAEVSQEPASNFEPEMPSMNEPEKRIDREAEESHASPSSSTSASPSLGSTSPSLDVTNVTQPSADTSPLGSVTIPMYESDARGGPRKTESYTPLDAGELWSEFGGGEPSRTESKTQQRVEPAPRAESKTQPQTKPQTETEARPQAETRAEAAPSSASPSSASPSSASPSTSSTFSQSSMLGLSVAPQATAQQQPRAAAHAQTHAPHAAPPPFTTPPATPAQVQPLRTQALQGEFESRVSPEVVGRYIDAYRAARATVLLGTVIKILAVLLGLVVSFGPYIYVAVALRQFPPGFGVSLLVLLLYGFVTFATIFIIGVIVSSLGRLRVAALDSAVNTSPFLTNEQRAEAMSLR